MGRNKFSAAFTLSLACLILWGCAARQSTAWSESSLSPLPSATPVPDRLPDPTSSPPGVTETPVALTPVQLATQTSLPPIQPGKLAFLAAEDGATELNTELYTILSDGSNLNLLVSEPMLLLHLTASPDGKQIAMWGCPGSISSDCQSGSDADIYTIDWDGGELRRLTGSPGNDMYPDWSPDGRIAFSSDRSGSLQIYVMNPDGAGQRMITNRPGYNREPRWSRDGKWIAYHCSQDLETRICVVSPDGQPAGEPIQGTEPVWSPAGLAGGSQLAFSCFSAADSDICTASPDGFNLANLTNSPWSEHSVTWSPDGSWISYIANKYNLIGLYKICATCLERTPIEWLPEAPVPDGNLVWSPDGSQIAFVDRQDLLVVSVDDGHTIKLAGSVFGSPVWRP